MGIFNSCLYTSELYSFLILLNISDTKFNKFQRKKLVIKIFFPCINNITIPTFKMIKSYYIQLYAKYIKMNLCLIEIVYHKMNLEINSAICAHTILSSKIDKVLFLI